MATRRKGHYANPPCAIMVNAHGKLQRIKRAVGDAVRDRDLVLRRRHADFYFLLQRTDRLDRRASNQSCRRGADFHGYIVREPSCRFGSSGLSRRDPHRVTETFSSPLFPICSENSLNKFCPPMKPKRMIRSHIPGDDKLDLSVADAVAICPTFISCFFHFNLGAKVHCSHQSH